MTKRKSGGARAGEARRARAAALESEHADWNADDLAAFAKLKRRSSDATGAYTEALDALRLALRQASQNPAIVPQQRHEQIGRIGAALVKAADPGRMLDAQTRLLDEANERIEELERLLRGQAKPQRDRGESAREAVQ